MVRLILIIFLLIWPIILLRAEAPSLQESGKADEVTTGELKITSKMIPPSSIEVITDKTSPTLISESASSSEMMSEPVAVEPTITPATEQPTNTTSKASEPSTPAGTGAGPTTSGTSKMTRTPTREMGDMVELPRAGVELGWLSLAGTLISGLGLVMRRKLY